MLMVKELGILCRCRLCVWTKRESKLTPPPPKWLNLAMMNVIVLSYTHIEYFFSAVSSHCHPMRHIRERLKHSIDTAARVQMCTESCPFCNVNEWMRVYCLCANIKRHQCFILLFFHFFLSPLYHYE